MKPRTRQWILAALLGAALAPASAPAQDKPAEPAGPKAIEVAAPGGAILSYRPRGSTTVELRGTNRASGASATAKVENRGGSMEIELRRGAASGLSSPTRFGSDFLTYVLWVVAADGAADNAGEITFDGDRSSGIKVTTSHQAFWLMVTAEPDFAVHEPSPAVVLVSQGSELATAVPGPLLYFTHYAGYDLRPASDISAAAPLDLLQARKAVELASKVQPPPPGPDAAPDDARAGDAFRLAEAYLAETERAFVDQGASAEYTQYGRTATQLAESARALATGAAGRLQAHQLEQLRARLERELANLRDRYGQLEASLDQERHHTRELEGDVLSLRERVTSLEATAERAGTNAARLEEQQTLTCAELRLQLASMGHLTEQGGAVMLDLASDVLFDSGRYELRPAAREGLGRMAAFRRLFFPRAVLRFEGHTDLVGEEDYNQWLSEQRALSVYRYFLEDTIARTADNSARGELDTELSVVEQLLKMNYNTARRQASQRQELLTLLGNRVAGKGMREPLVPEKGPNEQNRRVTLILAAGESSGPVSFCPMGESNP